MKVRVQYKAYRPIMVTEDVELDDAYANILNYNEFTSDKMWELYDEACEIVDAELRSRDSDYSGDGCWEFVGEVK